MATIGNTYLTLADLYKRQDPDGKIATVIEMLAEQNEILQDAMAVECNNGTKHLTTIRTGLPEPTWRKLYDGVQPTKSGTAQVEDTTGMLEAWSEIDAKVVDMSTNPGALRLSEARAFLAGMNNTMASTMIYGNTEANPERFMGLAPRFDDSSAQNGNQIIKAGGSGSDNTSVWFVTWGADTCHLLYPKGSMAGVQRDDKGKDVKVKSDGSLYDVYREKFTWDVGLSVRDWRAISRIANIDVSDLTKDAASGADLITLMIDAYYSLDHAMMNAGGGRTAIYCNRTIASYLHKQAMNGKNVNLTIEQFEGKPVTMFLGHPIRRVDAILNTEAAVS